MPEPARAGALLACASGGLLIASLFLPWFGVDAGVELPGGQSATTEQLRVNAWEAFELIDVVLFVAGVLSVALGLRSLVPGLPPNEMLATVVTAAGALAALAIVARLVAPPDLALPLPVEGAVTGRRIGPFFGLLATAGMAWGARLVSAPPPPAPASLDGFQEWRRVGDLREEGVLALPTGPGVFAFLRRSDGPPEFLDHSPGARKGDRDPTLGLDALEANWVEGADIVYLARAGSLRRRVRELLRFGAGGSMSNWGGRAVWQLGDVDELVLAWSDSDDARRAEADLLKAFRAEHGKPPFANDPHRLGR